MAALFGVPKFRDFGIRKRPDRNLTPNLMTLRIDDTLFLELNGKTPVYKFFLEMTLNLKNI